ncbi:hypothetical protein UP09_06870 [Bradyrhizobium sp. LTSP885]|nr:hypothetical protein UP09_06870 [Bradyrhizobium sp. LTSP885]
MVNDRFPDVMIYGFEMVDVAHAADPDRRDAINRKFTPNQIRRIFSDFSPILPQCRYFRFIDRCYS